MKKEDIRSVRRTWAVTSTLQEMTGQMFYRRLFEIAPNTRSLFQGDMESQAMKLVTTLDFIVDHLDQLDTLMPDARDLAIRHVAYGVTADQYPAVGEALIWTMSQVLGDKFTEADGQAWAVAYGTLSGAMIDAAYPDAATQP
ncbi:globin domain-containing protein [Phaeobacter marinintestinus]|uniref:globin domain-containing protein n=1 Tax=Falsiphaeobacter marinintestinus TaxID=1492905 RepID=UPI0011B850A0|nr:globin domain-containing protein [Phaeobacter marinintestinus]